MPLGRGSDLPKSDQVWLNSLSLMAFMGLPWPTKRAGMGMVFLMA
jgi:hypothetical protein